MRRYHQPAEVVLDENGEPTKFTAWGRTYAVAEQAGSYWEELLPWWQNEHADKTVEELTIRHFRVRANGPQCSAVVELVQRNGDWFVEGVED
ncbi:hypothetical protein ACFFHJ_35430 [Planotetraspora thailandica]|uniref:hypothetical protein n=1 Tax=Planotetraspora thailandica TaxID=487172 RepID=UPI00194F73E3|nr:hypothetical protein [Planotetraspora thailandica]